MRLKSMEIRNELLSKRNLLLKLNKATGSSYYLNEDIPKSEREEQARIRKAYKDIKLKDSDAKIKGKKILSQGRICTIDEHGKQLWEEMKRRRGRPNRYHLNNILYWNVEGIFNKNKDLISELLGTRVSIFCLAETWHSTPYQNKLNLDKYEITEVFGTDHNGNRIL